MSNKDLKKIYIIKLCLKPKILKCGWLIKHIWGQNFILTLSPGDTVQTGTGKVDPAL